MVGRVRVVGVAVILAGLAGGSLGCSKTQAPAPNGPEQPGAQPEALGHKHGELANSSMVADMHAQPAPNTSGLLKSTHTGTSAYDVSAPATVLVTTRWGHGSGVIIDPKGLVLTNYHVIESGETEDFGIEVGVTTAKINPDGSADPDRRLRARALKIDPSRDLALLQIIDPGDRLPVAPLAPAELPRAGRAVSAIGNAGVGFGWAVKHCHINAIGTMESAAMAIFAEQAEALPAEQRDALAEATRRAAVKAGKQIQTDCTVLPGDSGGPLLDEETHALVGLNAAIRTSTSGANSLGSVSFHVHIAEIHDFLADVPTEPQRFAPDPWELGGHQAALDDTTKDGEVDSLRVGGHCGAQHMTCHGIFLDMDQDSFRNVDSLPELQQVYDDRSFDPEWIIFARARFPRGGEASDHLAPVTDLLVYFDADNDGTLDGLVVQDAEAKKTRGYRIQGAEISRDESLDDIDTNPQQVFANQADRDNFVRFKAAVEEGTHATAAERSAAVEVALDDLSGDGQAETVRVQTRLDERVVLDVDQDSLPDLDGAVLEAALAEGKVDAELVAVTASPYRVWYDRDNDGRLDLMLEGSSAETGFVSDAAEIDPQGKRTSAPEHVGRRLLRPALFRDPAIAKTTEVLLRGAFPDKHADLDDGASTFPDPRVGPVFEARAYDGTKRSAVALMEEGRVMILLDLDRNSWKSKANKGRSLEELLREGAYDAEFVFIFDGTVGWSYFDVDNDGEWDEIWVSTAPNAETPRHRYVMGETITHEQPPAGVTMFEPSAFKGRKRLVRAFSAVRGKVVDF